MAGCAGACPAAQGSRLRWCATVPGETVALIRQDRQSAPPPHAQAPPVPRRRPPGAFRRAAADFAGFMDGAAAAEPASDRRGRLAENGTTASIPDQRPGTRPAPDIAAPDLAPASARSPPPQEGQMGAAAKRSASQADGDRLNDAAEVHLHLPAAAHWVLARAGRRRHALAALIDESASDPATLSRLRQRAARFRSSDFRRARAARHDIRAGHLPLSSPPRPTVPGTDPSRRDVWRCAEPVVADDWTGSRSGRARPPVGTGRAIYRQGAVSPHYARRATFRGQDPGSSLSILGTRLASPHSSPGASAGAVALRPVGRAVSPRSTRSMTMRSGLAWRPSTSPWPMKRQEPAAGSNVTPKPTPSPIWPPG